MAGIAKAGEANEFYCKHSHLRDDYWLNFFSRLFLVGTLIVVTCVFFVFNYNNTHHARWVDGPSMYPTLNFDGRNADDVYVSKHNKGAHGDIIVTVAPDGKEVIKRLIAVGGDTLKLEWSGAQTLVYVNGSLIGEPYTNKLTNNIVSEHNYFNAFYSQSAWAVHAGITYNEVGELDSAEITIPDNHVFYMGDNRGNSYDCRSYGPRPLSAVLGRVDMVVHNGETMLVKHINQMLDPIIQGVNFILVPVVQLLFVLFGDGLKGLLSDIGIARLYPHFI